MQLEGIIKSVQAAIAAGGADITQTLKVEILQGDFRQLRDLMQKPVRLTIEASQMEFGKEPSGAVDTTATNGKRGRKKKEKELVPA